MLEKEGTPKIIDAKGSQALSAMTYIIITLVGWFFLDLYICFYL